MNYLGIDYGLRHIGLAVASTLIPEPIASIHYRRIDQVWSQLDQVIVKYKITHLVLGISESHMADQTKDFMRQLIARYHLPINLVDETLSSYEARQNLAHRTTQKKKILIHSAAAAIILERYLSDHQPFSA